MMELVLGNIFIRPMVFEKAGNVVEGHAHNFDHVTYCAKGSFRIEKLEETRPATHRPMTGAEVDRAVGTFGPQWLEEVSPESRIVVVAAKYKTVRAVVKRAGEKHCAVLIEAGVCHRITALEDDTLGHCIYSHRNPQGEVLQEYDGWSPANV